MESQPQNPEFRINPGNFHPCSQCAQLFQKDIPISENSRDSDQVAFDEAGRTDTYRPRGYKTFFKLNSTEHEISTAHKNCNIDK